MKGLFLNCVSLHTKLKGMKLWKEHRKEKHTEKLIIKRSKDIGYLLTLIWTHLEPKANENILQVQKISEFRCMRKENADTDPR